MAEEAKYDVATSFLAAATAMTEARPTLAAAARGCDSGLAKS